MKGLWLRVFCVLILLAVAGCSKPKETQTTPGGIEMAISITSTAFTEGGTIPKKYTCDGENRSPDLSWNGVPSGVQSLALIADDPDAPSGTFVHWVLYNMPADLAGLPEGVPGTGTVQGIGTQGTNGARRTGYMGPCPPKGNPHRYYFKLYALDIKLNLKEGASKAHVEKAMQGHVLAQGQLMGKYGR